MISRPDRGWGKTRASLRAYAQAVTAFPRALAVPDPRWAHVAMGPGPTGFRTAAVALDDGASLVSVLDLEQHRIEVTDGASSVSIELEPGPAPIDVGRAIEELIDGRRSLAGVETDRYDDTRSQVYDPVHASGFLSSARVVVAAMEQLNDMIGGEVSGPHLWSHGFDIATEWYAERSVEHDGTEGNVTVMTGWFPDEEPYIYVNPWPFPRETRSIALPHGATWHTDGWNGAELAIPVGGLDPKVLIDVSLEIHAAMREAWGR